MEHAMTPAELRTLIAHYGAQGLLPCAPLVRLGGGGTDGHFSPLGVAADLVLELDVMLDAADKAGLESLDLYADTLVVPAGFERRLDGSLRRLTIVARRICTEGKTALRMLHDQDNQFSSVRLFVERIDGQFSLFGGPRRDMPYDIEQAAAMAGRPQFTNFAWQNGEPALRHTAVPPGLLLHGEPLHRVLAALFGLAAAIAGRPASSPAELSLCHDALGWIARWSGVETGFGELIHAAESLARLLPVLTDAILRRPIPSLGAAQYLELAAAHKDVMGALEAQLGRLQGSGELATALGGVASAFADRDNFELDKLKLQCAELEDRLEVQIAALDRAARTVRQEELAAQIAGLRLQLEADNAQIIRLLKLSFDFAFGIIAVAGSVAALCTGLPANPAALNQAGIDGVRSLGDMFSEANRLRPTVHGPVSAIRAVMKYFAIPFVWAKDNASTLEKFADPARSVLNAALPALSGPLGDVDPAELAGKLGDAMRALATLPDANEAKAAWQALENEAVNRLDLTIQEADVEDSVRSAASTLKTQVQKVAVYGRLLAEQSAARDAIASELAALKLQYLAVIGKRRRLAALAGQTLTQAQRSEQLQKETALRADGATRGFYVASYGARAAQAYETYQQSATRLLMPATAPDMAQAHASLAAELADARAASSRQQGELRCELRITDAALLERLSQGQPVSVTIASDQPELARYRRVRLSSVQAWLDVAGVPAQRINIELMTGSTFQDSTGKADELLFSAPQRINFTYAGATIEFAQTLREVRPTPFTTWLIEIVEPQQPAQALQEILALRLVLEGTALR